MERTLITLSGVVFSSSLNTIRCHITRAIIKFCGPNCRLAEFFYDTLYTDHADRSILRQRRISHQETGSQFTWSVCRESRGVQQEKGPKAQSLVTQSRMGSEESKTQKSEEESEEEVITT
jgi:hypothetical protein